VENPEPTGIRALFPKAAEIVKRLDTGIRAAFSKAKIIFKRYWGDFLVCGTFMGIGAVGLALALMPEVHFTLPLGRLFLGVGGAGLIVAPGYALISEIRPALAKIKLSATSQHP
jgi:hypothetical protein